MKLYLSTLALFILLAFMADTRITIKPFSISFGSGWLVIGIIFILCGCICLKAQWYEEGLKRGAEIKQEVIKEIEQEKIKEKI
jgi:hypothetical protein